MIRGKRGELPKIIMNYKKQENQQFALKLTLIWALKIRGGRVDNKTLLKIIKLLEGKS